MSQTVIELKGNDKNFKIVKGTPIETKESSPIYYKYKYLDFNNIQKIQSDQIVFKDGELQFVSSNNTEESVEKLIRDLMLGKTALIRVHSIEEQEMIENTNFFTELASLLNYETEEEEKKVEKFLMQDYEKYSKFQCCIETCYGSIISAPLVLNKNLSFSKNGLNISGQRSKGYNWTVLQDGYGYEDSSNSEEIKITSRRFGYTNDKNYIVNANSRIGKIKGEEYPDDPIIQTRTYQLNPLSISNNSDGDYINHIDKVGSFAFCYNIQSYNNKEEGVTLTQKELEPLLELQVKLHETDCIYTIVFDQDEGTEGGTEGGTGGNEQPSYESNINLESSREKNLVIQIAPDGQIIAQAKGIKVTGGMSVPSSDFLPPQCLLSQNTLKPLFIYPIYSGIVITNCINKNITDGGGQIFVKFQKNINPIQNLVVDTDKAISKDMNNLIKNQDKNGDGLLKWLPAIYQQTNGGGGNIRLRLKDTERIFFGNIIQISWIKSLGSFAYCPLFFYNKIGFDLFFKGGFVKKGGGDSLSNTSQQYEVLPIICDVNTVNEENNNSNIVLYKSFYDDDDLQESIYYVPFRFKNDGTKRYPIQVFGVVVVNKSEMKLNSNANGTFSFTSELEIQEKIKTQQDLEDYLKQDEPPSWYNLITNCQISCGLQGITGKLTLDSYMLTNSMNQEFLSYDIGEIDLDIQREGQDLSSLLFKGFGYELSKSNTESENRYQINLVGLQQKLEDIKLVCAPFWDGDKLQAICQYFENYANVTLKMVNNEVTQGSSSSSIGVVISNAIPVAENATNSTKTKWKSSPERMVDKKDIISQEFRVPRSVNWESPAVDYKMGTSCLTALKDLGTKTSAFFTVGLDGIGYFYEINKFGIPYYALDDGKNYTSKNNFVCFQLGELINFSMQEPIVNKYNTLVTYGFLQKKSNDMKKGNEQSNLQSIPGSFYTKLTKGEQGGITIPWTKIHVGVQNGFFTKSQLLSIHLNKLSSSIANISLGSITVLGNTKVNHVYQVIFIGNTSFFVTSIEHSIDVSNKNWTTTYQIQRAEIEDLDNL